MVPQSEQGLCIGIKDVEPDFSRNSIIVETCINENGEFVSNDVSVRAIPDTDDWFESVWQQFVGGEIYNNSNSSGGEI